MILLLIFLLPLARAFLPERVLPFSAARHILFSVETKGAEFPQNEFSRVVKADSILGSRRRGYTVRINARDDELIALAKRFDLPEFSKLEADLRFTNESSERRRKGEWGDFDQIFCSFGLIRGS